MLQRRTLCLSLLGATALAACGKSTPSTPAIPSNATVLALGDSLTAGVGAPPGQDWPTLLASMTGWNIINGGVSGDTAAQGLARLPQLLQAHSPSLVIVGLGGNDFLRRQSTDATHQALTAIVQAIEAQGALVVLQAIPQPNLLAAAGATPSDHPLYAELAKSLKVPLIAGVWGPILGDPALRADAVHANAQGYAAFAQAQHQALRELGLISASI